VKDSSCTGNCGPPPPKTDSSDPRGGAPAPGGIKSPPGDGAGRHLAHTGALASYPSATYAEPA
jgi:hypothetical protein